MIEVENVLNNRPLTYVDADVTEEVITPNRLICGRNLSIVSLEGKGSHALKNIGFFFLPFSHLSVIAEIKYCYTFFKSDALFSFKAMRLLSFLFLVVLCLYVCKSSSIFTHTAPPSPPLNNIYNTVNIFHQKKQLETNNYNIFQGIFLLL